MECPSLQKAASIVVPLAAGYLFVKGIRSAIAGANSDGKKRLEDAQARLASQSLRKGRAFVSITDVYEQKIMADLVFPEQIDITFDGTCPLRPPPLPPFPPRVSSEERAGRGCACTAAQT